MMKAPKSTYWVWWKRHIETTLSYVVRYPILVVNRDWERADFAFHPSSKRLR